MSETPAQHRVRLEDRLEMLRYSIEAMERQREGYTPGSLEWHYAQKIMDSCKAQMDEARKELDALPGEAR